MITSIFIDTANLYKSAKRKYGKKIDYKKLLTLLPETSFKRAYGIRATIESRSFIDVLKSYGFVTTFIKKGTNLNVDITLDVCKLISKLEHVVLVTNDRDIYPLVKHCRDSGIVVSIYGIDLPIELNGTEITEEILLEPSKNEYNEHLPVDIVCDGS